MWYPSRNSNQVNFFEQAKVSVKGSTALEEISNAGCEQALVALLQNTIASLFSNIGISGEMNP